MIKNTFYIFLILVAAFSQVSQLQAQELVTEESIELPKGRVYLKPEEGGLVTVTDLGHPGATYEDCKVKEQSDWCVAWPGADAVIDNLAEQKPRYVQTGIDPKTGDPIIETFVEVRVRYSRNNWQVDKKGWINARSLSQKPLKEIFTSNNVEVPAKPCPTGMSEAIVNKNHKDISELSKKIVSDEQKRLKAEVDALSGKIGLCPLNPADDKSIYQNKWQGKNIYDLEVMPQLKAMRNEVPKLKKSDGKMMNWDDLVNIDALSRTIYSEMNQCFKDGLEYPMAAAKVALNRVEKIKAKDKLSLLVFLQEAFHLQDKPTLAKVLTSDQQFSVWNSNTRPKDKTILMSLCPTRDPKQPSWMGKNSSHEEQGIWKQAMEIATEAVLHPKEFEAKTKAVNQLYYTSGRTSYDGRVRPTPAPEIAGRSVSSLKCMYLWSGK